MQTFEIPKFPPPSVIFILVHIYSSQHRTKVCAGLFAIQFLKYIPASLNVTLLTFSLRKVVLAYRKCFKDV